MNVIKMNEQMIICDLEKDFGTSRDWNEVRHIISVCIEKNQYSCLTNENRTSLFFLTDCSCYVSLYIPQHAKDWKLLNYTTYNKGKVLGVVREIVSFHQINYLCEVSKSSVMLKI